MTFVVALALLALTFIATSTTNALCTNNFADKPGTLIREGGDCSNAAPTFGL
jgi:hypothetical protein